jgi:glycosyltransferase involved in cell wall biosynthesis
MNIAVLTQYYPPEIGAPQARLSELAAEFVRRGHSVTVLTAMPNYPTGKIYLGYGGLLQREQRDGVKVIHTLILPTQKTTLLPRLANYVSFVLSSAAVGSVLLDRVDYLFVESPPLFLGLSGLWLSRLKRARLIFNVSDLWPESAVRLSAVRSGSWAFRASTWLEHFCYRHAWLVTGQSKSILANIIERFPECPTFHLSNGVDTSRFRPEHCSDEARATLGGKETLVVLYAGLHGLAQGLDQVLKAAEELRSETGLRFVFVGDGPEKKSLSAQARRSNLNNVAFLDPRPAHEIPDLVASADIVVVPLKMYIPGAVPSKLYEAMASGRVVILIAEGEAAEIVREHHAGVIVRPNDIATLTQSLRMLMARPDLRRKLGKNGRNAAETYFDRSKICERFIDYLEARL